MLFLYKLSALLTAFLNFFALCHTSRELVAAVVSQVIARSQAQVGHYCYYFYYTRPETKGEA